MSWIKLLLSWVFCYLLSILACLHPYRSTGSTNATEENSFQIGLDQFFEIGKKNRKNNSGLIQCFKGLGWSGSLDLWGSLLGGVEGWPTLLLCLSYLFMVGFASWTEDTGYCVLGPSNGLELTSSCQSNGAFSPIAVEPIPFSHHQGLADHG